MKKYLLILFIGFFSLITSAQDPFLVYSMQGEIKAVTNKQEVKINKGEMIASNAIVKISSGGVISFICKKGGWFSITSPGDYSLKKFSDSCYTGKNYTVENFTKYMWSQSGKPVVEKGRNRKAFFDNVYAVTRDQMNLWTDPMLDTVNYSGLTENFLLYWRVYSDDRQFLFSLYDPGNTIKPFYTTTVTKTKIPFTAFVSHMKPGNSYYWSVAIINEDEELWNVFNYVSQNRYDSVLANLKNLKPTFETPAEETYRLAFMLENARYFAEAFYYYTKAAKLEPYNVLYKATLAAFKKNYDIE